MATGTAALQNANPAISTVQRKPQTTANSAAGVPFGRASRQAGIQGFSVTGQSFGALITQPLKAVGGYLRGLWITVQASGGNGSGTSATASSDAPENVISSLLLRDPLGQPIVQVDGYGLAAIMRYSGQFGMAGFQDPHSIPSYSAIASTGNFTIRFYLPLELDSSGYCSLPSLNAAAQPSLQITLATAATVYSQAPAPITPTLAVTVDQKFWAAPVGQPDLGPPDVGSSSQWSQTVASTAPPSNASARIVLPRVGTYIHTLILVARDSNNARVDVFPSNDLTLFIDGVPVKIESESEHYDDQYIHFGISKQTGVLVYTFRNAVQQLVGSADDHDLLLATTPATLLEVAGSWQTNSNVPAQLTVYTGELNPNGGIPYNHLAQ